MYLGSCGSCCGVGGGGGAGGFQQLVVLVEQEEKEEGDQEEERGPGRPPRHARLLSNVVTCYQLQCLPGGDSGMLGQLPGPTHSNSRVSAKIRSFSSKSNNSHFGQDTKVQIIWNFEKDFETKAKVFVRYKLQEEI